MASGHQEQLVFHSHDNGCSAHSTRHDRTSVYASAVTVRSARCAAHPARVKISEEELVNVVGNHPENRSVPGN
jgi:hypothetical protein